MKTAFYALLAFAALPLAACAAPSADGGDPVVVTAEEIRALPSGQDLDIRLAAGEACRFDASKGPIDFDRVELLTGDGRVPMKDVMSSAAARKGLDASRIDQSTFTLSLPPEGGTATIEPERAKIVCTYVILVDCDSCKGGVIEFDVPLPC